MGTWKSRGLRGSALEELINITNDIYRDKKLALVQKIPTPITPIEIDGKRNITKAYFNQKSTVDYMGAVQGIPICFDAKECASTNFPLSNVHEHQLKFMEEFESQGGISFLILSFTKKSENYYLRLKDLKRFWDRMLNGGKKSFNYDELDKEFLIEGKKEVMLHYLEKLNRDLELRGRDE